MNAIFLILFGAAAFVLGYLFYSRFLAEKIFKLDPNFVTPAHAQEDGVDYVPTRKVILWGHHFAAVAGAAPIVGPAIAVVWGWLPAFLWVTLGTVFFAGVHDFGALWMSVRNQGRSIGALTEDIVGQRARSIFMIVIFLLLLMVNAVFAVVITNEHIAVPASVIPTWAVIAVAMIVGYLVYRRGMSLFWVTAIGVTILYGMIWVGQIVPLSLPDSFLGLGAPAQWVVILFVYAGIASVLPVWLLLQPRDYINGVQLFLGLGLLYAAVLLGSPTIVAPAFNPNPPADAPPLVPLLFVTIACGAISGFHGLVASGTTSKQLNTEPDARVVGYLGSVGEGTLALAAIVACSAGFASFGEWQAFYTSFATNGTRAWSLGGAALMNQGFGMPLGIGETLLAVMAILFAATTMDAGVRLQRYIVQEWGQIYNIPALRGRTVSTLVAVGSCLLLAFGAGGGSGTGGMIIWPLFGTTNQLLGALTLSVMTVFLIKLGRAIWVTVVPLTFLLVMTIPALVIQAIDFWEAGNWLLIFMDALILIASIAVALEALSAVSKARRERAAAVPAAQETA
ncbi:MAG TPA: carbon starvation protein A [Longimicrobiales bacterium]|nr:carbon starvation protein A [Longimicrobiales bacterium]